MKTGKKQTVSIPIALLFVIILILLSVVASVISKDISGNTLAVNANSVVIGVGQEYSPGKLGIVKSYNKSVVGTKNGNTLVGISKGSALVKIGERTITVTVDDAPSAVEFLQAEITIGLSEEYIPPLKEQESKCNTGFEYSSSDSDVVRVDAFGNVKGVAKGSAEITVKTYNGLSAACKVNVADAPESISYSSETEDVFIGLRTELKPQLPEGSASKTIKIETSNEEVLRIENGAKLVPLKAGEAKITATTYNGKTASCNIRVLDTPYYIRTDLDPSKPMIALSFDDGPNFASTNAILDVLEQYNASASFFIVGKRLGFDNNDVCARRMVKIGCQLGNHTYSHERYGEDVTVDDITRNIEAIREATGFEPSVFRPTGGYLSDTIKENCAAPIILWSVDTNDWKYRNSDALYNYVIYAARDGDIILMHDIYSTSATAVEKFVPELINRGYQIVNVAELAYYKGAELKNGTEYYSFN